MPETRDVRETLTLKQDESRLLYAQTGTLLISVRGTAVLTDAPQLIAESVFRAQVKVRAGQSHRIANGGWVTLAAEDDVEVVCLIPQTSGMALFRFLLVGAKALWRGLAQWRNSRLRNDHTRASEQGPTRGGKVRPVAR